MRLLVFLISVSFQGDLEKSTFLISSTTTVDCEYQHSIGYEWNHLSVWTPTQRFISLFKHSPVDAEASSCYRPELQTSQHFQYLWLFDRYNFNSNVIFQVIYIYTINIFKIHVTNHWFYVVLIDSFHYALILFRGGGKRKFVHD